MEWYEASEEQIEADVNLQLARQMAYYKTFLATPEGLAVLCDLENEACQNSAEDIEDTPQNMAKYLTLSQFYASIKRKCGVDNSMAILRAWQAIAQKYEPAIPEVPEKTDLLA